MQNSDLEIWNTYAKSITPIKQSNIYVKPKVDPYISQYDNIDEAILKRKQRILYSIDSSQYRKRFGSTMVKEIGTLTRKNQKHFRREATIDLHGIYGDLNLILEEFCTKCIVHGFKYIVIITGKGKGILKKNVIEWIQQHIQYISEYFEIKDSHKSCGSLGVHLRSIKKL